MMDESNALTKLHISVPVWLKNVLQEAAEEKGMSVSQLCCFVLDAGARDTIDLPKRPDPAAPVPTVADVLRGYVAGEVDRLIGPCGDPWPCSYDPEQEFVLGEFRFCHFCDVCVG